MNAIATAVEPLRAASIQRAREFATATVASMCAQAAAGETFPYPKSIGVAKATYMRLMNEHKLAGQLFKRTHNGFGAARGPDTLAFAPEGAARFVAQAEADASAQFNGFVAKLADKAGQCETATVATFGTSAGALWCYSVLTVTKAGGVTESWKTQQILNVSVLGKVFNQYPTRKMK